MEGEMGMCPCAAHAGAPHRTVAPATLVLPSLCVRRFFRRFSVNLPRPPASLLRWIAHSSPFLVFAPGPAAVELLALVETFNRCWFSL